MVAFCVEADVVARLKRALTAGETTYIGLYAECDHTGHPPLV